MDARIRYFALALASALALPALAGPASNGALATPANAVVGLWITDDMVGPCGGPAVMPVRNTLLFHAGGTVIDNPRFPPGGVNGVERSQGLGVWWYDPATKTHVLHLRFDRFLNGAWVGHSTVDREFRLSADGESATGPVHVVNYDANGVPLMPQICGNPVSHRLM